MCTTEAPVCSVTFKTLLTWSLAFLASCVFLCCLDLNALASFRWQYIAVMKCLLVLAVPLSCSCRSFIRQTNSSSHVFLLEQPIPLPRRSFIWTDWNFAKRSDLSEYFVFSFARAAWQKYLSFHEVTFHCMCVSILRINILSTSPFNDSERMSPRFTFRSSEGRVFVVS